MRDIRVRNPAYRKSIKSTTTDHVRDYTYMYSVLPHSTPIPLQRVREKRACIEGIASIAALDVHPTGSFILFAPVYKLYFAVKILWCMRTQSLAVLDTCAFLEQFDGN